jgi:DNA-binding transcriptional LysR family regulator
MNIGYEVFLCICKEKSISRAARKLYITQQAASDHVRRLEKKFDVKLFVRRPIFKLTDEGKIMQSSLQMMKNVEINMKDSLKQYSSGKTGKFRVGISTSRAPIILPKILPKFMQEYPAVTISFDEEDTQILAERLKRGDIDLFIGVNTSYDDDFEIRKIANDKIKLVISNQLLKKYGLDKRKGGERIDLKDFASIPFIIPNFDIGKVSHVIQEYLSNQNVKLNVKFNISDSDTQLAICSTGACAAICPQMLIAHSIGNSQANMKMHVYDLKGLENTLRIDVVTHKNILYPKYVIRFIEILSETIEGNIDF